MKRPYNFYAGPAILPLEVMKEAQEELLDCRGMGLSILEISHRSKEYDSIHTEAREDLREVFNVPDNYKILFLQGGASTQFAMVPMNFLSGGTADYVETGTWAKKAIKEAKLFGTVNIAGSAADKNFSYIPSSDSITLTADARYVHITSNETISGTQWKTFPDTGDIPLVADMSSDILSRQVDISKFGIIYAGAQKNMGPAGVTLVIIREDLLDKVPATMPSMLNYKLQAEKDSLYNTPPAFSIYIVGKVMKWIKKGGGLSALETRNADKAAMLYAMIDNTDFYNGTAAVEDRSNMNVSFRLPSEDLEKKFIQEGTAAGFIGLKGHRSVGGCRASIYNAFPAEGVTDLVDFMKKFQSENS